MRTYHFFMKFMRSFLIGFGCAAAFLAVIAALVYTGCVIYFA
jgi:hypothetical protein